MTEQQVQPTTTKADPADVEKNKVLAIVGYIIPILFFIPLLSEDGKKSPFAKFHSNQQLNLLLFGVIGYVVASILVVVLIGIILFPILWLACVVFFIMGIINVVNGEMKPLPLIGKFKLIK